MGVATERMESSDMVEATHGFNPEVPGVEIRGELPEAYGEVLSSEALALVADLHRHFESRRQELLARRLSIGRAN